MKIQVFQPVPGNPRENMDRDRAIAREVSREGKYAVLRWYWWTPSTFSLGFAQKPENLFDHEKLESLGIPWVKRPTGGSLVYHEGDLSYSFTVPRSIRELDDTSRLYALIAEAWITGLSTLGIEAKRPEETPCTRELSPLQRNLCLASSSPGDLMCAGKKIGGSAQRRMKNVWLQQGFLLLEPAGIPDCLLHPEAASQITETSSSLWDLGYLLDRKSVARVLTDSLSIAYDRF